MSIAIQQRLYFRLSQLNSLQTKSNRFTQDRLQCTYNVTLRRVRVTIVAVEKLYVLLILTVCL